MIDLWYLHTMQYQVFLVILLVCSLSFKNYVMKTILPDAESHEEHHATKYSPIG